MSRTYAAPRAARTSRRRRGLLAAGAAVLLSVGLVAPAQAAGPTNGPLLVQDSFSSVLRTLAGSKVADLKVGAAHGVFSPAGDKIAYVDMECPDDCTSSLVIVTNTGEQERYDDLADQIDAITWAPDGNQVAFLSYDYDAEGSTISRLPLSDGASPVTLLADGSSFTDFGIEEFSNISWSPDGQSIVFVGHEPRDGSLSGVDTSQLYTIPSAGGSWSRYNVHFPDRCKSGQTCFYSFEHPQWSPDGSQVVVEATKDVAGGPFGMTEDRFLATIGKGDTVPTKLTDLRDPDDGYQYFRGPTWSADGSTILFQDDDGSGAYSATISAGGSGRKRLPDSVKRLIDWQPCPTGTCAEWGAGRIPTSLSVTAVTSGVCTTRCVASAVSVRGSITPGFQAPIALSLQAKKKGKWVTVTKTSVTSSATGDFTKKFGKPGGSPCRLKASYAGNKTYAPSSLTQKFAC